MKILFVVALITSHVVADKPCPTITTHSLCPTCPVPECLRLSTVTIPCGCSTAVPTTTVSHPCKNKCWVPECGGTSYAFTTESCHKTTAPTSAPTTVPTTTPGPSCPTVTTTFRPADCTQPPPPPGLSFCAEPQCILLSSMTWPCSCVGQSVPTATVTTCQCRTACATTTQVLYLPCATSVQSPPPTTSTDGPACGA